MNQICYHQTQLPQLSEILVINDPDKSSAEFWPYSLSVLLHSSNPSIFFLVIKGKRGYIYFYQFKNGCCASKKQIKILNSVVGVISTIKTIRIPYRNELNQNCSVSYLFIGYQNGIVDIYGIVDSSQEQSIKLQKKITFEALIPKQMPIINIEYCNNSLIVCHTYEVYVISQVFERANPQKLNMKAKQKNIEFPELSYKLNLEKCPSQNSLYIYNEFNGSMSFNLTSWKFNAQIKDSIRFLTVLPKELIKFNKKVGEIIPTVVIGTTDDSLKFIDYNINLIIKYVGFKNYPSCHYIQENENNGDKFRLWVGCLDGTISCFYFAKEQVQKKTVNDNFLMKQMPIRLNRKICQGGITNIIVQKDILIVKDTQYNIYLFDILR